MHKPTLPGASRGERGAGPAQERAGRRPAAERRCADWQPPGGQLLAAGVPVAGHGLPVPPAHVPGGPPSSAPNLL